MNTVGEIVTIKYDESNPGFLERGFFRVARGSGEPLSQVRIRTLLGMLTITAVNPSTLPETEDVVSLNDVGYWHTGYRAALEEVPSA